MLMASPSSLPINARATGEEIAIDSTYAGVTGGVTLTGIGWALRALVDYGIDTTGLATASVRASMTGGF